MPAFVAMLFALAAQTPPAARDPVMGRWSNPKGTLAVETHPCPDGTLCGTIVWASAHAQAAARQAKLPPLVGTRLLHDYRRVGAGHWEGRVFIPDMGRSYASHIQQHSPARLTISQCLLGRFLCKSQVWHRIC